MIVVNRAALRVALMKRGISQAELARKVFISHQHMSDILKGEVRPSEALARRITEFLEKETRTGEPGNFTVTLNADSSQGSDLPDSNGTGRRNGRKGPCSSFHQLNVNNLCTQESLDCHGKERGPRNDGVMDTPPPDWSPEEDVDAISRLKAVWAYIQADKKLSLRGLAREIGISHTHLTMISRGKVTPSAELQERIWDYLYEYRGMELFNQHPVRKILPEYPDYGGIFYRVEKPGYSRCIPCKKCGSERTIKKGYERGYQRWLCRDCGYKYRDNGAPYCARTPANIIAAILELFFEGLSLRKIQKEIESAERKRLSEDGIRKIIIKQTKIMIEKSRETFPEVGSVWQVEGTYLDVDNRPELLVLDVLDLDTGYILASEICTASPREHIDYVVKKAGKAVEGTPDSQGEMQKRESGIASSEITLFLGNNLLLMGIDLSQGAVSALSQLNLVLLEPRQIASRQKYASFIEKRSLLIRRYFRGYKDHDKIQLICDGWRLRYNDLQK